MTTDSKNSGVLQNLGWHDRVARVIIGAGMIAVPCYYIITAGTSNWYLVSIILLAVYPLLTGIIGVDQLYRFMGVKSCGTSERNQCGTFPFEVDAALGHHPIPRSDIEHSLESSSH